MQYPQSVSAAGTGVLKKSNIVIYFFGALSYNENEAGTVPGCIIEPIHIKENAYAGNR